MKSKSRKWEGTLSVVLYPTKKNALSARCVGIILSLDFLPHASLKAGCCCYLNLGTATCTQVGYTIVELDLRNKDDC